MTEWHKVNPQTWERSYSEWHTKHDYESEITLNIDHRGSLEISVDDRYLSLRAKGIYEALKKYYESNND